MLLDVHSGNRRLSTLKGAECFLVFYITCEMVVREKWLVRVKRSILSVCGIDVPIIPQGGEKSRFIAWQKSQPVAQGSTKQKPERNRSALEFIFSCACREAFGGFDRKTIKRGNRTSPGKPTVRPLIDVLGVSWSPPETIHASNARSRRCIVRTTYLALLSV